MTSDPHRPVGGGDIPPTKEPHGVGEPDPLDHAGSGHGDDHGHGGDHGDEKLGPIDVPAWTAGALGIFVGIVTAACFALTTGAI
jgi:hypothetical protein